MNDLVILGMKEIQEIKLAWNIDFSGETFQEQSREQYGGDLNGEEDNVFIFSIKIQFGNWFQKVDKCYS